MQELMELAPLAGSGGLGAVLTFLAFRLKTKSDLEKAYMNQLAHNSKRISELEDRLDTQTKKHKQELEQERKRCDKRMQEMDQRWSSRLDQITEASDDV